MYCPNCGEVTVCRGVNPSQVGAESGQRWERTDYSDIQWFRRGRICQECGHEFVTAEIQEDFLEELVDLRNALSDIKENAEAYIKESSKASRSLEKLSSALSVLRALRIYKNA